MSRQSRVLVAIVLAGAAVALFGRRAPEPRRVDPPPWVVVCAEPASDVIVLRSLVKRRIAREVAAGDRSLVEAAALFGELNRLPPVTPPQDNPGFHSQTEGERLCRQVIHFARVVGPDWPAAVAKEAADRLEAELREELARDGTVRLPDPAGLSSATALLEEARARLTEAERRQYLPDPGGRPGE